MRTIKVDIEFMSGLAIGIDRAAVPHGFQRIDRRLDDAPRRRAVGRGDEADAAGIVEASFEDEGAVYSNILVLGSAEMVSDQFLMFNQFQNRAYILSLINGMTGKTSTGMTIEPKVISANIFDITAEQIRNLKIIFIGVIPAVTLITGLVIWLRRKNR